MNKNKTKTVHIVHLIQNSDRVAKLKGKSLKDLAGEQINVKVIPLVDCKIHRHEIKGFSQKRPSYSNDYPIQAISGKTLNGEEKIYFWKQIGMILWGYLDDGKVIPQRITSDEIPGYVNRAFSDPRSIKIALFSH